MMINQSEEDPPSPTSSESSPPSASNQAHQEQAAALAAQQVISCAVLTISDTRTKETDKGGTLICDLLTKDSDQRFTVADYTIVKDDADAIDAQLQSWYQATNVQAILTTGGTGIARRDTTIEVVERSFAAKLDGFGELFRMLSWDEVQASAMLSRATAGLVVSDTEDEQLDTFIFCMPGSTNAVRLAMNKLILPELPHLIWERSR